MRIVITDCDHDGIAPEREVAARLGAELDRVQALTPEGIVAAARDADAITMQYAPITGAIMDSLPRLRAIGRYGVGVDTIDIDAATERGIAVCSVPDYGTEEVSDHAVALALTLGRAIARLDRAVRAGSADIGPIKPLHRLRGQVFGVLGFGRIGEATARKARGIGFEVIAYDLREERRAGAGPGVEMVSREELLARSDVLSLHVPLDATTHHLADAAFLAATKPGAYLVNTCRGGVVDTAALVDALSAGRLGGAALDVHETEPLPVTSPLLAFENVVLTPHAAWYSEESYLELKRRAVENPLDVLRGVRPRDILNPEVLDAPGRNSGWGSR